MREGGDDRGTALQHSVVAVGSASAEAISRIRIDVYVMGVTGLHPKTGATTGDAEEAAIKRLIVRQSAETIVLATREKLGAASLYSIVQLADIGTLVTEGGLIEPTLAPFRSANLTIVQS